MVRESRPGKAHWFTRGNFPGNPNSQIFLWAWTFSSILISLGAPVWDYLGWVNLPLGGQETFFEIFSSPKFVSPLRGLFKIPGPGLAGKPPICSEILIPGLEGPWELGLFPNFWGKAFRKNPSLPGLGIFSIGPETGAFFFKPLVTKFPGEIKFSPGGS